MTIERDMSVLNSNPAQVRAVMHRSNKVLDQETVEGIWLMSSMKVCSKGNVFLLVINLGTLVCIRYSSKEQ